jgi:mono/diheme cytochrome c family protein
MRDGLTLAALLLAGTASLASAQPPELPPPAAYAVDFARDVAPLLRTACVRCHARGRDRGGFSIETRDLMLKGGDNGPAVVPGRSAESYLISLVAGLEPENVMPQKGSRLTAAQVGLLRAWIDQGAAWDPAVSFARTPPRNLTRRTPELPARPEPNPVDRLLQGYLARRGVGPGRPAEDRVLARRLYLDVIGVLPSADDVRAFAADPRPDKRDRLVATLLADERRYAEHWLSFWNDLLRNDYRGTGYIDGGRLQITSWLYAALANNLPYDRFVASLVNPVPGTEGFTKGIVWRGVVNASQTPEMQAAQNISQVFMGVNLKCASCHDSFINDWQLADAYGMASVYAETPLEMVECDRPTGKTAAVKFLYDGLGDIDGRAARPVRLDQLMHALTGPKNGRLARTIVNRLWARFMGYGLVEPLDDMDQVSWHPDLLDWLAEDLVAHGYDLKHTMAQILRSQAYQRDAVDRPETTDAFVFRGPLVRRMTAEQFADAVGAVSGVWAGPAAARVNAELIRSTAVPRPDRTRAALVPADPLTAALGRPNREQVVTVRQAAATTLQSLELLNGATLSARLRRGAERIAAEKPAAAALVADLFGRALGRGPTARERDVCLQMLGGAVTADGVEDLLWSIVMLPEFQLVR